MWQAQRCRCSLLMRHEDLIMSRFNVNSLGQACALLTVSNWSQPLYCSRCMRIRLPHSSMIDVRSFTWWWKDWKSAHYSSLFVIFVTFLDAPKLRLQIVKAKRFWDFILAWDSHLADFYLRHFSFHDWKHSNNTTPTASTVPQSKWVRSTDILPTKRRNHDSDKMKDERETMLTIQQRKVHPASENVTTRSANTITVIWDGIDDLTDTYTLPKMW